VPCYDDIRSLTAERLVADGIGVDLICGGFPCQPFSSAARGRNSMDSYLWPEMLRLIESVRPAWLCAENVADLERVGLETVCADLEGIGYEVQALEIPACAVDADHVRRRLWILGHTDCDSESRRAEHGETSRLPWVGNDAGSVGTADGLSSGMDTHRMRCLGNAIVPQIAEIIGRAILTCQ